MATEDTRQEQAAPAPAREWVDVELDIDLDAILEAEARLGVRLIEGRPCEYGAHGSYVNSCSYDAEPGSLYCSSHAEMM